MRDMREVEALFVEQAEVWGRDWKIDYSEGCINIRRDVGGGMWLTWHIPEACPELLYLEAMLYILQTAHDNIVRYQAGWSGGYP